MNKKTIMQCISFVRAKYLVNYVFIGIHLKMSSELLRVVVMAYCPVYGMMMLITSLR